MTIYRKINDVEFDHVFTILSGGTIVDGPRDMHAPESTDEILSDDGWTYWSAGRSGQYGYRGPIMHASEYIGGGFERDMLSDPGIYAVVVDNVTPDDLSPEDIPDDFPVHAFPWSDDVETNGERIMTCGTCGLSWDDSVSTEYTPVSAGRCPFETWHTDEQEGDTASGWAVVKYTGTLPVRGRYIGLWHGGHSYSHPEWTDAEWFGSLSDAVTAIRQRRDGWFVADYVMRAPDDTRSPCAHSEGSGSIFLYRVPDGTTADDVEMITGAYPDRVVRFGPRGGVRVENV